MRSQPLAAILLALALPVAACQVIWSYDDFENQHATDGSVAGDAGSDAAGLADGLACEAGIDCAKGALCDGADGCGEPPGAACPDGDDAVCSMGSCIDGICCALPCPPCQTCTPDGWGCVDLLWWSTDTRCMTSSMKCDGAGNCF